MTLEKTSVRWILFLFGAFLTALYAYGHLIDGDVIQMLCKADKLAAKGVLIPFGSVSSSGASGNIPGAFLTLSSGLPMKLWYTPWAALVLLAIYHCFAFFLYQQVLKHYVSTWAVGALVVFFWLNPWRMSEVFLWNPGYIFLATVLHMWSAFHLAKKRSFLFSCIHGLSIFLALQIHPSFVILVFITVILLWMKALQPHLLGTISGVVLGLVSLTPYLLWGLEDPSIFPQPGGGNSQGHLFFGLTRVYPLLKGFWYWILFSSNIFQTHVFHQIDLKWLGQGTGSLVLGGAWAICKYSFGLVGVGLSFFANYRFYQAHKKKFRIFVFKMQTPDEWLSIYTIAALIAALIATAIAPTLPIYWHLLFVWPMALVPVLLLLDQWAQQTSTAHRVRTYLLLLILYFSLTNFLAAMGSKKHDVTQPPFKSYSPPLCD